MPTPIPSPTRIPIPIPIPIPSPVPIPIPILALGVVFGARGIVAEQAAVVDVRMPELRTLLDPSLSHATCLTEADVVRTDPQTTL